VHGSFAETALVGQSQFSAELQPAFLKASEDADTRLTREEIKFRQASIP